MDNISSNRLLWLDNLRGFSILLVVLGHCLQYLGEDFNNNHLANFIYSFHMPLFMFISGYSSNLRNKGIVETIKKRCKQLLIPYFFWTVVVNFFLPGGLIFVMFEAPAYWFLLLLFIIIIINSLSTIVSTYTGCRQEYINLMVFVLLLLVKYIIPINILSLNILCYHFLFFSLGYFFKSYQEQFSAIFNNNIYFIMLMTAFIICSLLYRRNESPMIFNNLPSGIYFIITGTLGSLALLSLFLKKIDCKSVVLEKLGTNTLGIYVIHLLILIIANYYGMPRYNSIICFFFWIVTIYISLFISSLLGEVKFTRMLIGK